jgi:hypothetical protein
VIADPVSDDANADARRVYVVIALAPATSGTLGNDLPIGNKDDGMIDAFDLSRNLIGARHIRIAGAAGIAALMWKAPRLRRR